MEGDLKDLLKSNDLSNQLEEFSAMQQNKGVFKMLFEANLGFNEPANPVKAQTIFPKDKNLFNLEVTKDSIDDNNFNLNLRFTCDSNDEAEFSKAFKTDDGLFGLALITQGEKLVHTAPTIVLESLSNMIIIIEDIKKILPICEKKFEDLHKEINSLEDVSLYEKNTKFKNLETDIKELEELYSSLLQNVNALATTMVGMEKLFSCVKNALETSISLFDNLKSKFSKEYELFIYNVNIFRSNSLEKRNENLITVGKQHTDFAESMDNEKSEIKG